MHAWVAGCALALACMLAVPPSHAETVVQGILQLQWADPPRALPGRAQRHRLGWTEDELRREYATLVAEVERVVLDSSLLTGSPPSDTLPLLRVILQEASEITVRGFADAARRRDVTSADLPTTPTDPPAD